MNGASCTQSGLTQICEASNPALGATYKLTITKETVQADKYQEVWNTNVEITEKKPTLSQMIMDKATTTSNGHDPVSVRQPATNKTQELTDYRYMGSDPDNYILFNCSTDDLEQQNSSTCEVWRIIGIVDGKVKLIREDTIGKKKWEGRPAHNSTYNYDYYAYDWQDSGLYQYLNGEYYDSLSQSAKSAIDDATWYLGTWNGLNEFYFNIPEEYQQYVAAAESTFSGGAYYGERSDNTYSSLSDTTTATGKVGIMYPSDYGYSSSACYSTCTATSPSCGSQVGTYHLTATTLHDDFPLDRDYSSSECKNSNWMYKNMRELTLTYIGYYDNGVCTVTETGEIGTGRAETHYVYDTANETGENVRPTVYLKNSVVVSGSGSSLNPYKIVS